MNESKYLLIFLSSPFQVSFWALRFTIFNSKSDSPQKHPFLLALRRWGRFARRTRSSTRNFRSGEE